MLLLTSCFFQGLPFQKVQHKITTQDPMPGLSDGGVLILITGQLLVCTLSAHAPCGTALFPTALCNALRGVCLWL